MKHRLRLLKIFILGIRKLALLSLAVIYGLLFLVGIYSMEMGREAALYETLMAAQLFLPLGLLLWEMVYFHLWVDDDGQEALRSIDKGKRLCLLDLLLLAAIYTICMGPGLLAFTWVFGFWPLEILRILIEMVLVAGVFYFLGLTLHSVTLGGMAVIGYLLFSALSAVNGITQFLAPLQAMIPLDKEGFLKVCIPALGIGLACFLAGGLTERFFYRKY